MEQAEQILSKAQKRKQRTTNKQQSPSGAMRLQRITPLTETQSIFFRHYNNFDVLSLHGYPGTGKSFLALFKALENLETEPELYKHVKIVRSSVSSRDMGFQPGNAKEKMSHFESPYASIFTELYGRGDAYEVMKNRKQVEFTSTSFMRGQTFRDCIVIIDECQNMSYQELNTLLTRVGDNCKLILCGDVYQDDLTSERFKETSGYRDILQILSLIKKCKNIEFQVDDIVRSGFVKDFILAKIRYEKGERVKPVPVSLARLAESLANNQTS